MHEKHKNGIGYVDPATWSTNSYWHRPVEDIEPLPDDKPNSYREAALQYMEVLANVDIFMTKTKDPRLAWVSVAIILELNSVGGLSQVNIAGQLGVSEQG